MGIDVSAGTTATLDTPFTFSAAGNALQKNDLGTLIITANNSTRSGTTTIVNGVIQINNANALGSGQIILNGPTATSNDALWLTGGITLTNAINTAQTAAGNGVNNTGVIFSVSGVNTVSGSITNVAASGQTYGAANGATLNLTNMANSNSPTFNAVGTGIVNLSTYTPNTANFVKIGTGTLNILGASPSTATPLVQQGTVNISGTGQLTGTAGNITVQNNALLNVDDTGTALTRIGGTARTITLNNGNFAFTANGAAASALSFGALAAGPGANKVTLNNGGASTGTLTFASLTVPGTGGHLLFESTGTYNATTNRVIFNTTPVAATMPATFVSTSPVNTNTVAGDGIILRAIVKDGTGTNFATYTGAGAAGNLKAYSTYTTIDGTGTGSDLGFTNANGGTAYGFNAQDAATVTGGRNVMNITGTTTALSNPGLNLRTTNALKISGAGTGLTFATSGGTQLAINTGMILATGAGQTIGNSTLAGLGSAPAIFFGTAPQLAAPSAAAIVFTSVAGAISVDTGASLAVNAAFYNTADVTKSLDGSLTFNTKQFFNAGNNFFTVAGGTTFLTAGENTLWQGAQGGTAGQNLSVGPGATLNLGANAQMVGEISAPNRLAFAGSGGVITGTGTLISAHSSGTTGGWGGSIQGTGLFFNKSGANNTVFFSDNTYTGATLITGGTLTLNDEGKLSGTTSIAINGGTLAITDTGTMPILDRINTAATLSMRGGIFNAAGRDAYNSSQTLGDVLIAEGGNNIVMTVGGTGTVRSQVLALGNITQTNGAMLLLNNMNGQAGNNARMTATNGLSLLVNGIVPWMNSGGGDLVSYVAPSAGNATGGFAPLASAGYQGYDGTVLPAASNATGNYKVATAAITLPSGGLNLNALVLNPGATQTITFGNGTSGVTDVMNLTAGMIIKTANFNTNIGAVVDNGRLTAGGAVDSVLVDLNFVVTAATANPVVLNSRVVDNSTELVRLTFTGYNTGALQITNGANTYSGGTIVNTPNSGQTGFLDLNVTGATGATGNSAIPLATTVADSLIINGGTVRLLQANQINFGITPVIRGDRAALNLNNNNQTLAGLNFDNDGGSTAPSLTTGTGILTLTGNITATSGNVGTVSTISGAGAILPAAGATAIGVDLNGTTRNINAAPVTINGNTTVANVTPTLSISTAIGSSSNNATTGLNLTGSGLVQLSGANLFGGGVSVNAGGLAVGGSTNVTTRDGATGIVSAFTNGPIGTGALSIGAAGTYLTSTASTNILSNAVTLAGAQITLKGTNSLTLQGNNTVSTLTGNTIITVDTPQAVLTMNMVLDDASSNYGITKEGLGTLILGNNNTFTGGVTVNAGTLALAGLNAGSTAPVFAGTNATIGNGGLLALTNSGTGSLGLITYANNIITSGAVSNLHIGNNGANTQNTIVVNDLALNGGNILNVSSANGYLLRIANLSGDTSDSVAPMINVAAGTTVIIFGYSGDKPINIGQGTLQFPDLVTIGQSTSLQGGAAISLGGSYPLGVQNAVLTGANMTSFGYTSGGLTGTFATMGAAPTAVVNTQVAGIGFSGNNFAVSNLGDGSFGNRPSTISGTGANTTASFSGFLEITTAGTYTFRSGTDDGMTLYIDGNAVASDAFSHGFTDSTAVSVPLTAGYHAISYKFANAGSGGGYRVLYSGADTGNAFQTVGGSKTFSTSALPTAANGYNGAAIILNDYSLAASTTATLDTAASQFGAVIGASNTLTLGNNSVLNLTNGTNGTFGTGWFGAGGATSIGNGVILATTNTATSGAGTLQLLGAITQTGTGLVTGTGTSGALIKTGQGTLVLGGNNTATFTGDLVIQNGFVQLNHAGALPSGVITVANNGAGVTQTMATTGTTVGSTSVTVPSTAGLQVGMTVQNGTAGVIPTGAYIVSVDSATTFTLSQAALTTNNTASLIFQTSGSLDLNGQTAVLGNIHINGAGNGLVNLSTGTSAALALASGSTGALWNSSGTAASFSGSLTLDSTATIGGYGDITFTSPINTASGVGTVFAGSGTITLAADNLATLLGQLNVNAGTILKVGNVNALGLAGSGAPQTVVNTGGVLDLNGFGTSGTPIGESLFLFGTGRSNFGPNRNTLGAVINSSSTAAFLSGDITLSAAASVGSSYLNAVSGGAAAGDITFSGIISGGFLLTKVGSNTLTLTGANTQNGLTITQGNVIVSGAAGAAGSGGNITVGNAAGLVTGITPTSTLTFDNSGTVFNSRAGGAAANRSILLQGGTFVLTSGSTTVNEAIGTGGIQINNAHNLITLSNTTNQITEISGSATGTITRNNNGTALIRGTNLGLNAANTAAAAPGTTNSSIVFAVTAATVGQAGANGATTKAITPWAIADPSATGTGTGAGAQFMVYDGATNGFRPLLTATEMSTTLTANNNVRMTGALSTTGVSNFTGTSINSLTVEGGSLSLGAFTTLQLQSGGVLAKTSATISSSGSGIGAGAFSSATAATELIFHVYGSGNTLTSNAAIGGAQIPITSGLTKAGDGMLVLNAVNGNSYTGTTTLNLGTLQFGGSAPNNALFYQFSTGPAINATASTQVANALVSNAGSTLDLNGHSQVTADLLSRGTLVGSGGIITNTSGTLATYTTTIGTARDFAGQINGNLNFVRTGGANVLLSLRDNNQFTGNATIMSGITSLVDQGTFSGMAGGDTISIRNALLRWDDSGIQELNNRIASTVALSLDGGAFEYISRGAMTDSITLGDLSVTGGTATLRVNPGNGGFGAATLILGGTFTRSAGATLNFTSGAGIVGAGANITATAAALNTNTNGILGGWATVNTTDGTTAAATLEFATYDAITGIRQINLVEQTTSAVPATAFSTATTTSNHRLGNLSPIVPNGGVTMNSFTWNGLTAAQTMTFAGPGVDTLTVNSGGMIFGSEAFARTIGATTSAATRGRITSGIGELFIHNGANTLTIHSDITGTLDLVLDSGGTNAGSLIVLNNANSYTGNTYVNGVIVALGVIGATSTTNAITGDLMITGGNLNGTGSGAIANSRVVLNANNQINDASDITVRGGSQFDLNGFNDTVATLTFNSQGGYNDGGPLVQTGAGRLTLTGNILSTNLDDVRAVPTLSGNLGLGATPTITVDRVTGSTILGTRGDLNEQVGLDITANISGGASITKAGLGALQLAGTSTSVTAIALNAGSIVLGPNTGGGSNFINAQITMAAGTILDMRGFTNTAIGSIVSASSTAVIKNFSPTTAGTLVTGSDNVASTSYAGVLASDYTTGLLNVTKIGTGDWNLTADNSANILGTLQISGGTVTLNGTAAKVGFVTTILAEGGTLKLDNSTNVLGSRLGGTTSVQATAADRAISMRGGILDFRGGSSAVVEAVNTITNLEGASKFALTAGTAGTSITAASVAASSTTNRGTLTLDAGSGQLGGGTAASGRVNVSVTTANLVNNIRPDMIGIDSSGTGFVTSDANGFRLLTSADTALGYVNPLGTYLGSATPLTITATAGTVSNVTANTSNVDVTSALGLHASTTINSLNLSSGGGLTSIGGGVAIATSATTLFNAAGTLNTLGLNSTAAGSGAILAETGNLGITGGALQAGTGTGLLIFHTTGNLTSSAYILGSGGIVKDGVGTLTLNKASLNTGATFMYEGTLVLGGGANTLLVIPTAGAVTVADLVVNGGTIKLNGNNQAVRQITNTTANNLANTAGTIVNDSAVAANLYTAMSGGTTFAGTLGVNGGTANENNFSVDKAGNQTWTLTGIQYYTGATNIRAGTLLLQDSGAITGGGAINANFATLSLVNSGLSHVAARTGASAINLTGGTLSLTPRAEGETSATTGAVTLLGGQNTITIAAQTGIGGSLNLSAGALTRTAGSGAVLTMSSATGQIGRGIAASAGQSGQVTFSNGATILTNNIIGGWATNGVDFLTYLNAASTTGALGVGLLGDTGSGFTDYTTRITAAGNLTSSATNNTLATGNFNTNVNGNTSLNSLAHAIGAAANNLTFTAQADTLTLTSGGYVHSGNFTGAIGQNVDVGRITSGGTELFIHNNQSTLTINSRITGTNKVVFSSVGSGTIALANGTSTLQNAATVTGTNALVTSTANMFVGQTVAGPGGYTGTITAIVDGTNVTLSGSPTAGNGFYSFGAVGTSAITGATNTSGNATVTFAAAKPGLFVGQPIFGTGVALGTTISTISADGLTITMSAVSTAAVTAFTAGSAGHSYTGGTVVNNGATLQLNSARAGEVVIPSAGGLVINGGAVTYGTNIYGAIASGTAVTINGAGSLTLPNYAAVSPAIQITNTFGLITLNGNGGAGNPTLQLGTPAAGQTSRTVVSGITSSNDNLLQVPSISGNFTSATQFSTLQFSTTTPTITVNAGANIAGLLISAHITTNPDVAGQGAIVKAGLGGLALTSSTSTWTTGLNLTAGTLIIGAASTPTTASTVASPTTVTAGPLGTGTLTISDATTIETDNTARTIANAIAFATPGTASAFTIGGTAATHNITLNGVMNLGTATRTINVTSPQVTATIGGQITGTGAGLTKGGDGILVISQAANDYTGATTVNGGMLSLGAAGVIPNGSALVVNSGGTFNLAGFAEQVLSLSSGSSTTGGLITNSGAAATLTLSNTTGSTTFGGVISNGTNALNLAKLGASTQVLSNQNTYTGTTTVTGGILEIATGGSLRGTSALNLNTGGNFRISRATDNVVSFTNPTTFTAVNFQTTGATLSLANALTGNNQRFGALTFSASAAGTLDFGTGTTNSLTFSSLTGSANGVTVIGWTGSVYALSATADSLDATQDRLLFTTTPGFATNTRLNQFSFTNDAGVLVGRGLQVSGPLSTFEIVPVSDAAAYWNGNIDAKWNSGTATNTNWWTTAAGSTVATLPGIDTDVFMTANSATNLATTLEQSFAIRTLTFTGTGTSNTAGVTIASGTGSNSLTINNVGGITVDSGSGANTISANVILGATQTWTNNSGSLLTVSGSVSETAGGSNENLTVAGSGNTTISGSVILGSGTVTKTGTSTLTFTAVNTYTGLTDVQDGTLAYGVNNATADGASIKVSGGTLAISTFSDTVAGVQMTSGSITGSSGVLTSTSNFDLQSGTASAILDGSVGLDKTTSGTVTLSGANTYTGTTTVSVGTLVVQNAAGLGTTAAGTSVTSGATLQIDNVAVSGEALTLNGTGVGGNGSLTGTGTASSSGAISLATDSTVGVAAGADTLTLSGVISGTATGLTKVGAGTLILSNDNTYTGATAVNGGTLQLGNGTGTGSLSTSSVISVGTGATFAIKQSDTVTQGTEFSSAAITGAGGFAQTGTGTTVLTAANGYTGTTTVSDGQLHLTGSLSTGAVNVGESGGSLPSNAAILSGNGTIGGAVTIGSGGVGILRPGATAGTDDNGTLTLTAGGTALTVNVGSQIQMSLTAPTVASLTDVTFVNGVYNFAGDATTYADAAALFAAHSSALVEANSATPGNHDFIKLTGANSAIDLSGTLKLTTLGAFTPAYGQVFNLFDWAAAAPIANFNPGSGFSSGGTFGSFDLPDIGTGLNLAWDTSAFTSYGILVVVPEPSRMLLLMFGLLGLFIRRRRW